MLKHMVLKSVAEGTEDAMGKDGRGSPPAVIGKVVSQAIKSQKPKTRYVAGNLAKPLMFVRKWFGDRVEYSDAVKSTVSRT